jgi:Tfp pilus assembly protein PilN
MKAVNLLPSDLKPAGPKAAAPGPSLEADGDGIGAFVLLGALAAVAIGVVVFVLAGNTIKDREGQVAAVKVEQQVAEREVARLAPYGQFQDLARKRLDTVRDLASSRFDWEQALRDLSRALPRNVTLDSINGTVRPGANSGAGGGANTLRGSIAAPAIELSGCTRTQSAVARMMSQLRNVQGVTRVALSKSNKDDAGAGGETGGCGRGAPPRFEVVVFFETATATQGGTAVTPQASATPQAGAAATPQPGSTTAPAVGASPQASPTAESSGGATQGANTK